MTLQEAIILARQLDLPIARHSWTHADSLVVKGHDRSYGGGELYWKTGERVSLFYVDDFMSQDWGVVGMENCETQTHVPAGVQEMRPHVNG